MKDALLHRLFLSLCFIFFATMNCFAQRIVVAHKPTNTDYWLILKEAQSAFENNDFGEAIKLAEQAKQNRRELTAWESYILEQTQKSYQVRNSGDLLDEVLAELRNRNFNDAVAIVTKFVNLYGKNFFDGKFSAVQRWVSENYKYPEADFLIGKIYRLEGESDMAAKYLNDAHANVNRLDIPEVKYDILYELADLANDRDDGDNYEKYLLAILSDDGLYRDKGFMQALVNIIYQNNTDSVDKFFLLYRSENDISIKALEALNTYYNHIGKKDEALQCAALGSITALTKIEEVLKDRLIDYSYTDLTDLLQKASMYSDICEWGNDNNIWRLFHNLAETSADLNKMNFANGLFQILAENEPEEYWRREATHHLKNQS